MFAEHGQASFGSPGLDAPFEPGSSPIRGQLRFDDGLDSRANYSPVPSANFESTLSACEQTLQRCSHVKHKVQAAESMVMKQSVELMGIQSKIKSVDDMERALTLARKRVAEFERLLAGKEEESRRKESALEERVRKSEMAVKEKQEAAAKMTKDFETFIRDHLVSVESLRVETLREDLIKAQADLEDARMMLAESDMQMEKVHEEHANEVAGIQEAVKIREVEHEKEMAEFQAKVENLESRTQELQITNEEAKNRHARVEGELNQEIKTLKENLESHRIKVADLENQAVSNGRLVEETREELERESRRMAGENQTKLRALESLAHRLKEENDRIQDDFQERLDLEEDRNDRLKDKNEELKRINEKAEKELNESQERAVSLRGQLTKAEMELGKIATCVSSMQSSHRSKISQMEKSHRSSIKQLESKLDVLESQKRTAEAELQALKTSLETRNQPPTQPFQSQPQPQCQSILTEHGQRLHSVLAAPASVPDLIVALQAQLSQIQQNTGPNNQEAEDVKKKLRHYIATVSKRGTSSVNDASTSERSDKKKKKSNPKKETGRHSKEESKNRKETQPDQPHQATASNPHEELTDLRNKHDVLWRKYWRQSLRQKALQQVVLEQREAQSRSRSRQASVAGQNVEGREELSEIQSQQLGSGPVENSRNCDEGESSEMPDSSETENLGSRGLAVQPRDLVEDWDENSQRSFGEGARVPQSVAEIASRYWGDEGYLRPKSAAPSDRRQGRSEMPAPQEVFERAAQFEGLEGRTRPCSAPSSNIPRTRPVDADDLISNFVFVDHGSDTSFSTSLHSGDEEEISQC
ncbi:hypothetical protein BSKO_00074 [Bryopsis sp. KO-2023]|nr:hypothetical protein BSKO_00074 [Bryopsis sp. KO-2023]